MRSRGIRIARRLATDSLKSRVLALVAAVPEGRVTTYGAIARFLQVSPREVARVLAAFTPDESATYPWFRVVAANGVVSTTKLGAVGRRQIGLLRGEGLTVSSRSTIAEFDQVLWRPGES